MPTLAFPVSSRLVGPSLSVTLVALALAACSDAAESGSSNDSPTGGNSAGGGTGIGGADTANPSGGTGGSDPAGGMGGATDDGTGGLAAFALSSPHLTEGGVFAAKHTCALAGFNGSLAPELAWTEGPAGTKSYAITFIDVSLSGAVPPNDNGYHWVIYDIPAEVLGLPEEFTNAASIGAQQNRTYLGPCPNFGNAQAPETHTYEFRLYALDSETLDLTQTSGIGAVKEAEAKLEANHLAVATLSGTSDASPP